MYDINFFVDNRERKTILALSLASIAILAVLVYVFIEYRALSLLRVNVDSEINKEKLENLVALEKSISELEKDEKFYKKDLKSLDMIGIVVRIFNSRPDDLYIHRVSASSEFINVEGKSFSSLRINEFRDRLLNLNFKDVEVISIKHIENKYSYEISIRDDDND